MSKQILIVEDEAIIALMLEDTLVELGYHVCAKIDKGEDVLEAVKKYHPNLILMDIMLKGEMTGVDASLIVKEHFDIPVIFLTAYSNNDIFSKAKVTEPYGYILKPFQERELQMAIEIAFYKYDAEQKVKISEKKYRELTESIPQIVFECNKEGKLTYLNNAGFEMLGYSKDVFKKGINITSWFSNNKYHQSNFLSGSAILEQGVEELLLKSNNEKFFVQLFVNSIIEKNQVEGLRGVIIDITERKRKEEIQHINSFLSEKAILKNVSIDKMFSFLIQKLSYFFEFEELYVSEYNYEKNELTYLFHKSKLGKPIKKGKPRINDNGLSEYVIKNNTPLILNGNNVLEFHKENNLKIFGKTAKSWMGVPIRDSEKVNGAFCVLSYEKEYLYSKQDLIDFDLIANYVGVILEKIRSEEILRQSEVKHKKIFNSFIDVYFETNKKGDIEVISPSLKSLLGYNPEEVIGKNTKFFAGKPDDVDKAIEETNLIGYVNNFRSVLINKKNIEVAVEVNSRIRCDENGILNGYIGVIRDVDKLVKNEIEIKKLSKAVEHTQDLVCVSDYNGNIEFVNDAYEKIAGYTKEELKGRNCKIMKSGFHDENFYSAMWKILKEDKKSFKAEFVNRKRSGEVFYEDKTISPIKNEFGKVVNFVSIGRDITEKKNYQFKLEESERRFRNILEDINLYSLQLDCVGRITFANNSLMNVLDMKKENLLGFSWFRIGVISEDVQIKEKEFLDNINTDVEPGNFDCNLVLKNGKIRNVLWSAIKLYNEEGHVSGKAFLGVDTTESIKQKKRNDAFIKLDSIIEKRNRKKAIRNHLLGQEAERSRISKDLHDGIGQNLAALKFAINSLKNIPNIQTDYISEIYTMVDETIGEVRKVSHNLLPSVLTDFGLIAGIEKVIKSFEKGDCTISLIISGEEFRFLEEAEVSMFRIFQEALNNALKHSKATVIQVLSEFENNNIRLTVKDNGIGMKGLSNKTDLRLGNGVRNMYERAEMIGAELEIKSTEAGTRITVNYTFDV